MVETRETGTAPAEAVIDELKSSLRGPLIGRNDEGYEEARRVYNGMIDRRPRLIARCADAADIIVHKELPQDGKEFDTRGVTFAATRP